MNFASLDRLFSLLGSESDEDLDSDDDCKGDLDSGSDCGDDCKGDLDSLFALSWGLRSEL